MRTDVLIVDDPVSTTDVIRANRSAGVSVTTAPTVVDVPAGVDLLLADVTVDSAAAAAPTGVAATVGRYSGEAPRSEA